MLCRSGPKGLLNPNYEVWNSTFGESSDEPRRSVWERVAAGPWYVASRQVRNVAREKVAISPDRESLVKQWTAKITQGFEKPVDAQVLHRKVVHYKQRAKNEEL